MAKLWCDKMTTNSVKEITSLEQLDMEASYTYADYLTWKLKERVEIIKGKIMAMSPAPNRLHQRISMKLTLAFAKVFEDHSCELYTAPFDVRFLDDNDKVKNVVQPDLCVICDLSKLDEKGCLGAPDLIVEILSPSNSRKEIKEKYELYQEQGVKEYWVVYPVEQAIQIFVLDNGKYVGIQPVAEGETVTSIIFPNLYFSTAGLYDL